MKIIGIGTDIVDVRRIRKSIKKKNLLLRIFNQHEIKNCEKKMNASNCYAKRFAAKEAFSKALGTGFSKGINLNEIIISNNKNGKPFIKLVDNTKERVDRLFKKKKYNIFLSLSDESNYALAFVTISI